MPKDEHPPAFLLYVDDFTSDGIVEAMDTTQVGAYFLLLCKAWRENPPGSIPSNDHVLSRWARLTPEAWAECRAGVLAAFSFGNDNRWHQKRMRKEFAKLTQRAKEKSQAAKRAAAARWNPKECGTQCDRNADALPKNAMSTSSSSSSSSSSSKTLRASKNGAKTLDARIEFSEDEIPEILEQCTRVAEVIPTARDAQQKRKDRSLIFKAVVLSRTVMSEDWLEDSIEAIRQHPRLAKKVRYFYGVLKAKCENDNLNLNQLLAKVTVPQWVLDSPESSA